MGHVVKTGHLVNIDELFGVISCAHMNLRNQAQTFILCKAERVVI